MAQNAAPPARPIAYIYIYIYLYIAYMYIHIYTCVWVCVCVGVWHKTPLSGATLKKKIIGFRLGLGLGIEDSEFEGSTKTSFKYRV